MLAKTIETHPVHPAAARSHGMVQCSSAILMVAGILSLATGASILSRIDQFPLLALGSAPMFVLGATAVPLAVALNRSQRWAAIAGTFCAFAMAILHISWFAAALSGETFFAGQLAATTGALVAALVVPWALDPILTRQRKRRSHAAQRRTRVRNPLPERPQTAVSFQQVQHAA